MMKHEPGVGRLYEQDDEEVAKVATGLQAEQEEISDRYGAHSTFFVSLLRQKPDRDGEDDDLHVACYVQGCADCYAFALAKATLTDVKFAEIFERTVHYMKLMKDHPDLKREKLIAMPIAEGKPN